MTTFQQPISVRTNLFTNPSAEVDASGWGANLASVAQTTSDAFSGSASVEATYSGTAGDIWVSPTSNNFLPVVGGQPYSFSIYVKDVSTANTFQLGLDWYTGTPDYISTNNSGFVAVSTSAWTRINVSAVAPALATQVGFRIRPNGTPATGTTARFDAALFEQSANVGDYFDGSTAGFTQANLITNPSFETNATGWFSGQTANVTQSTDVAFAGTYSGLTTITNAADNNIAYFANGLSAVAGQTYTYSAYTYVPVGSPIAGRNLTLGIEGSGATFTTTASVYAVLVAGSWVRSSITVMALTSGTFGSVVHRYSGAGVLGATLYTDGVLLERGLVLNDFYTGNFAPLTQTTNAWATVANASVSVQTVTIVTTQTTPTTYRYLFADLVTNQILAELPLTNVSFTTVLNGAGAFSGTMLVTDATQSYLNIWGATQPARTAVYVERFSSGGSPTLVWGGIVWARDYNSTTQHVTFNASEFESYFDRRKIISVSGGTGSQIYKNTDPVVIARTLIQNAETFVYNGSVAVPQSNIGVNVGSETSSATVSKTYYDAELKSVLSAIQDLSHASTSGFDFKIVVAYDSAFNPTKTFKIGYPRLGTAYSATNPTAPVMEFPGNVIEYTLLEDGTLAANYIYAVGVGNGQGKLNLTSFDSGQWSAGWPLLEGATNYGDVSNQALLLNLAQGQLAAVKNPPISLKIVYPPYQDPVLGSYALGDDVRIRINDDRSGQVDDYYRIVSISVTPGENNAGERATLTLTQKGAV